MNLLTTIFFIAALSHTFSTTIQTSEQSSSESLRKWEIEAQNTKNGSVVKICWKEMASANPLSSEPSDAIKSCLRQYASSLIDNRKDNTPLELTFTIKGDLSKNPSGKLAIEYLETMKSSIRNIETNKIEQQKIIMNFEVREAKN